MTRDLRASSHGPLVRTWHWLARGPCGASLAILVLSLSLQGFLLSKVPASWVAPNTRWELPAIAVSLTLLALVGAWRVGAALDMPARAALLVPALTYPLVFYVVA